MQDTPKNRHENVTLQHLALHLAKYAGELASIAEHLDHPGDPAKAGKAARLAQRWLQGRKQAIHWCAMEAQDQLQAVADTQMGA